MELVILVDLYAGGGGTSRGAALACQALSKRIDLTAINHWPEAVETHRANHPWAKHLCTNSQDKAFQIQYVPSKRSEIQRSVLRLVEQGHSNMSSSYGTRD